MLNPLRLAALLTLLFLVALPAAAQRVDPDAPFDPSRMDRASLRFVQAALAVEGEYDALLDGAWGRGSREALEAWTGGRRATWRDVSRLVRAFDAERRRHDWAQVWQAEAGIGHLLPYGLLELEPARGDALRYAAADGSLSLTYRYERGRPDRAHAIAVGEDRGRGVPYTLRRATLMVTAGTDSDGRRTYLRSERLDDGRWATHSIRAAPAAAGRLQLIASSFSGRREPALAPAPGSLLAGLVSGDLRDPAPRADPAPPSAPGAGGSEDLEALLGTLLGRAIGEVLDDRAGRDDAPEAREGPPLPPPTASTPASGRPWGSA